VVIFLESKLNWLLYILVFVFGYVTCKTFYFFKATRLSINLIKVSQLLSLIVFAKSLEHFMYARTIRLQTMSENNESEHNINAFTTTFDGEVEMFKRKGIDTIIKYHCSHFRELLEFQDWKTAMAHLDKNKEVIIKLLLEENNEV